MVLNHSTRSRCWPRGHTTRKQNRGARFSETIDATLLKFRIEGKSLNSPACRFNLRAALPAGLMLALLATGLWSGAAHAQRFPARAIHVVVPFPTGGGADILMRTLGDSMTQRLGQPVVIDNRPGGSTIIGSQVVARSAPDGYTMLIVANSFTINPALRSRMPYEALRDFTAVSWLVNSPQVLVVPANSPLASIEAFLGATRAAPGKLSYGALGPGATQHIAGELLKTRAHIDVLYVPFAGGVTAVTALLGGSVDAVIANYSEVAPLTHSGRLRALAVSTAKRLMSLPQVPTIAESGLPGFEVVAWFGLVAPAGTPPEIVQTIRSVVAESLKESTVLSRLETEGYLPVGSTPEEFSEHIRRELSANAAIVKAAGINLE